MKLQCACGAKYAFDATPEMLQNPVKFVCPTCGLDSSEFINELIRKEFGAPEPAYTQPTSTPPPAPAHLPYGTTGGTSRDCSRLEILSAAPGRSGGGKMRHLPYAHLPEMHGEFRLFLFPAVPQ